MIRTALAVAAVFLIAGLTWWLLARGPSALPPPAAEAVSATTSPAEPVTSLPSNPEPAPALRIDPERLSVPVDAEVGPDAATLDEVLDDSPEAAAPDRPAAASAETMPPSQAAPAPAPAPTPVPPPPSAPVARSAEPLPLKDMPPSFRSEFPALSVQVHVYDANPLRRFVLINGKKYRETDTLVEGPKVVEIVPGGVVLEHRGTRVLQEMPR
jgi:general secretion pathway protein B